jgi:uncharacterized protein (TIGR02996 family)
MSPDEDALLNGIAADPAADLPRLVYADWLEEHGHDLRAEFIRVQCEIAKLEVGPRAEIDRNVHLWRRQQELLDGHLDKLLKGVPYRPLMDLTPSPRFYRGFLDEFQVTSEELSNHGESLVGMRPRPSEVGMSSDALMFFALDIPTDAACSLVTTLTVEGTQGVPAYPDDTAPYRVWPRVRNFTAFNTPLTSEMLFGMLRECLPALQTLNLGCNMLNDNDVIEMLNAGILQRLTHISLIENAIGDQAAIELADRLGNSKTLKELDLRRNGITTVGQAALLARLGSKVILF